jgi:hypothetical protein
MVFLKIEQQMVYFQLLERLIKAKRMGFGNFMNTEGSWKKW